LGRTVAKRKERYLGQYKKKKKLIMGCPRPKYFFSGLPNLLPQKIRLPLISFLTAPDFFFLWSQLHKKIK
jgi:hypothetical protein